MSSFVDFDVRVERFRDRETGQLVSGKVFRNIFHAIASIAKDARRSIKRAAGPSTAGRPPHTRRRLLARAIRFHVDKQKQIAVAGPRASVAGEVGAAHEVGGVYKGDQFEARPFMAPALNRNLHRLGGSFTGSVGG